jgi:uncharacterized protein (DUF488 family)
MREEGMKLYTIGFSQKSAEQFFELLRHNGVQQVIDIRLRPQGQLAGFARQSDLPYFLKHLADGCEYIHLPELAPTDEILDEYRAGKSKDWDLYEEKFQTLLGQRGIPNLLDRDIFEGKVSCLLCSEPEADHCHRRLVAERLRAAWDDVEVIHL